MEVSICFFAACDFKNWNEGLLLAYEAWYLFCDTIAKKKKKTAVGIQLQIICDLSFHSDSS